MKSPTNNGDSATGVAGGVADGTTPLDIDELNQRFADVAYSDEFGDTSGGDVVSVDERIASGNGKPKRKAKNRRRRNGGNGDGNDGDGDKLAITRVDAIADEICKHNDFARDGGGKLYRYSKGAFRPKAEQYVKAQVKALLVEQQLASEWSSKLASEVVEFIAVDSPELPECPRADLINVENGMVRIED